MFFSSIGFSLSTHYCGDGLEDWSIWLQADDCNHEENLPDQEDEHSCCTETVKTCDSKSVSDNCCTTNLEVYFLDKDVVEFEGHNHISCLLSIQVIHTILIPMFTLEKEVTFDTQIALKNIPILDLTSPEVIQCFII